MDQYEFYHSCASIAGYVFDAQEPGSGKTFDWSLVKQIPRDEKLFLLAGGLTPDNVQTALPISILTVWMYLLEWNIRINPEKILPKSTHLYQMYAAVP